eukprot:965215-Prymnesium_polylepis.2
MLCVSERERRTHAAMNTDTGTEIRTRRFPECIHAPDSWAAPAANRGAARAVLVLIQAFTA